MTAQVWQYQVRINIADAFAGAARAGMTDPALKPLADVLTKHNAVVKNQFDAFADFCKGAEDNGETDTELYKWTKDTIEKPEKVAQYATRFTVYVNGDEQLYDKAVAEAIESDLRPLVASGLLTRLNTFDSNPANNPQPPRQG